VRDRASFIPELQALLRDSGRLNIVPAGEHRHALLGERFRFHESQGHTPGLLCTEYIDDDGAPVVFAADLVPGAAWVHLPITMGYDRFPERLIDEKTALFTDLLARGGRLFFTHDPTLAIGTLKRDEKGRFGV
jgi:glyoxylase-like metal-dependent hydrolase (beta-lactamase superfamily II)